MSRRFGIAISTIAVLLAVAPAPAEPGGAFALGSHGKGPHGSGFGRPHGAVSPTGIGRALPPARHHVPFAGRAPAPLVGVVGGEPDKIQVVAVPVVVPQPAAVAPAAAAEAPDPKFVFPPPPLEPSPGLHTVIVQRGSRIETTAFPVDR